jgi:hypothetical protein
LSIRKAIVLALVAQTAVASAPDYLTYEEPIADSVDEIDGSIGSFGDGVSEEDAGAAPILPGPTGAGPFWRDTGLDFNLRSYYLERNRDQGQDSLAWALGGSLAYRSGLWKERFGVGATLYTTQRLYGPDHKPGSGLLKPVQQGFTVLGEAFIDVHLTEQLQARLFRQTFDLPYVNRRDIRMVPNTFEAYGLFDLTDPRLKYFLGHAAKIRTYDSDRFIHMSEAAGSPGSNDGVTMIGARYSFNETNRIGAINHYGHNTFNTFFSEASGAWDLTDRLGIRLSGQYTYQNSVGDELVGRFNTSQFGIKSDFSYAGAVLTLAYVQTGDGSDILNPWGGSPSYSSLIVEDFDRAGEKAWRLGLSYDFAEIGWGGLSGFMSFASGNTPDQGANASEDQEELDFTLDYKPAEGVLKGLWLRARAAFIDRQGPEAQDMVDYRIILNYERSLL